VSDEEVELRVEYVHSTDDAILIDAGLEENVWLPKSQVDCIEFFEDMEAGKTYSIFIPEWLATEKELI
jgi:hypothetical protein